MATKKQPLHKIPTRITAAVLSKELGACNASLSLFRKHFPRGATFSEPNFSKAQKVGLPIVWLLNRLLARGYFAPHIIKKVELLQTTSAHLYNKFYNSAFKAHHGGDAMQWARISDAMRKEYTEYNQRLLLKAVQAQRELDKGRK